MDALRRLAWFPGFRELTRLYRRCQNSPLAGSFETRALATLGIAFELDATASNEIPQIGPLIVAANHPTGIADGLVLIEAIRRTRRDVRIVANHLLACIPELGDSCFFVDPFARKGSASRNVPGLRAAHRWLCRGGCVVLFPAGEVASHGWVNALRSGGTPADSSWHSTVGRLAIATRASVVPAFVAGRNSALFYAAGTVLPTFRTALLGRELLRHRRATLTIRFGQPVTPERLCTESTPEELTRLVRGGVDALSTQRPPRKPQPIPPARRKDLRLREIESLPAKAKLLTSGAFDVFCAEATRIPNVMDEIGRLREITFRAAGEGTGLARDIDRFDGVYQHLFVWDRTRSEIVGAYRVGATDRIRAASGVQGLYTSTLFRYDEQLLGRIAPALELGRSFVRPEYQRSHSALLLLWKGIGTLVVQSPQYRVLFGAVSISNRYSDRSQSLVRSFLTLHHQSDFARLVHAVNPPSPIVPLPIEVTGSSLEELDELIRSVERHAGVPVLLRHYLRLNAKLLGFNVDHAFGNTLDALMMVDLAALPTSALRSYLGRDGAKSFLEYHTARRTTPQRAA